MEVIYGVWLWGPGVPQIFLRRGLKFAKKLRFRPKVGRSNELIYTDQDTIRPVAAISVWEGSGV